MRAAQQIPVARRGISAEIPAFAVVGTAVVSGRDVSVTGTLTVVPLTTFAVAV
jgi:hypothetical protein